MPDRVYLVFGRHTTYTDHYDGVKCSLYGVYEDKEAAFATLIRVAEKMVDGLKEVFKEDELYHTYDGEGYYEILAGDDTKYEYFVVDCEPDAAFCEEIS